MDTRNSRLKQGHQKHQIVTWPKAYLSRLLWKRFWDLKLKKVLKPCWGGYWLAKKVHFFSLDPLWNGYPEFAFTVPLTIRFHPKMRPDEGPVEGKSSGLNWCSPDWTIWCLVLRKNGPNCAKIHCEKSKFWKSMENISVHRKNRDHFV